MLYIDEDFFIGILKGLVPARNEMGSLGNSKDVDQRLKLLLAPKDWWVWTLVCHYSCVVH